jgi:hypothetical protein
MQKTVFPIVFSYRRLLTVSPILLYLVRFVSYEDFIPQKYLPTYHWRSVVTFLPQLEGLADNFLFVPEGSYFVADLPLENVISHLDGHHIYTLPDGVKVKEGVDATVLLQTQKLIPEVPDYVDVIEYETRSPILMKQKVCNHRVISGFSLFWVVTDTSTFTCQFRFCGRSYLPFPRKSRKQENFNSDQRMQLIHYYFTSFSWSRREGSYDQRSTQPRKSSRSMIMVKVSSRMMN